MQKTRLGTKNKFSLFCVVLGLRYLWILCANVVFLP